MAAVQAALDSMTPEQRAQLQALAAQLFEDLDLRWQMDRLAENLRRAVPGRGVGRRYQFSGVDPMGLADSGGFGPGGSARWTNSSSSCARRPPPAPWPRWTSTRWRLGDRHRRSIRGNRDGRNDGIAVGRNDRSLIIQVKLPGARIGDRAVRSLHLKESRSLNRHIQRIVRLVHLALRIDHLGRRRLRSETDLQSCRHRVLALRRARGHQVLVDHILKLQPQLPETRRRRVGQVVGNGVEIQLLCAHAACRCVQRSNHFSPRFFLVLD